MWQVAIHTGLLASRQLKTWTSNPDLTFENVNYFLFF